MRISVNDITVSYTDEGTNGAPALIFLHGFPLNKSMWNLQAKALEDDYRILGKQRCVVYQWVDILH